VTYSTARTSSLEQLRAPAEALPARSCQAVANAGIVQVNQIIDTAAAKLIDIDITIIDIDKLHIKKA